MSTESSLGKDMTGAHSRKLMLQISVLEAKLTAAEKERDELRAALELGQINCDAVYEDLRRERDEARLQALDCIEERNAALARAASVERVAGELAEALEEIRDGFRSDGYVWAKNGDSCKGGFHRERSDVLYDYANKALTAYKALQPGREKALGNDVRTT